MKDVVAAEHFVVVAYRAVADLLTAYPLTACPVAAYRAATCPVAVCLLAARHVAAYRAAAYPVAVACLAAFACFDFPSFVGLSAAPAALGSEDSLPQATSRWPQAPRQFRLVSSSSRSISLVMQ